MFLFKFAVRENIGDGIGDKQRDRRCYDCNHDGIDHGAQFRSVGEKGDEIAEGDVHVLIGERVKHDHEHGNDHEEEQEHGVGDAERLARKTKFHRLPSVFLSESLIFSLGMTTET